MQGERAHGAATLRVGEQQRLKAELHEQQFSATPGNRLLGDSGQRIARQPMATRWPSLATVGDTAYVKIASRFATGQPSATHTNVGQRPPWACGTRYFGFVDFAADETWKISILQHFLGNQSNLKTYQTPLDNIIAQNLIYPRL